MKFLLLSVLFAFALCFVPSTFGIPVDEDLTLTFEEKQALEKLTKLIEGRQPPLPHEYMKTPIYLIKWLRYKNLDVLEADAALQSHIEWMKEMGLDSEAPDFVDNSLDEEYPIFTEGVDKTGRPVIVADVSAWDVRRAVLTGQTDRVLKHVFQKVELTCKKIRDKQAKGEKVTQMQIIFDLKGYNLVQHGCLSCLTIYVNFLIEYRKHFPGMADNVLLVNTPPLFATATEVLNLRQRSVIKIYGNMSQWQDFVFSIISPDQLPEFLGGTWETKNKDANVSA